METRTYVLDGVETREEMCPDKYFSIRIYHPGSTPWDYQCSKKASEWQKVMAAAEIPCVICTTKQKRTSPQGSGPGGRVRFGDDMMPGNISLCIPKRFHEAADNALSEHARAVNSWLYDEAEMPAALR